MVEKKGVGFGLLQSFGGERFLGLSNREGIEKHFGFSRFRRIFLSVLYSSPEAVKARKVALVQGSLRGFAKRYALHILCSGSASLLANQGSNWSDGKEESRYVRENGVMSDGFFGLVDGKPLCMYFDERCVVPSLILALGSIEIEIREQWYEAVMLVWNERGFVFEEIVE
ncbi:hypothetical protein VNO77_15275 [Canavalia gladiata]|uniref:Uncharacterized protein n=1 Tax=Canavalia gladiata TaxID=3824 RepID=A0AAN9M3U4_CANGL